MCIKNASFSVTLAKKCCFALCKPNKLHSITCPYVLVVVCVEKARSPYACFVTHMLQNKVLLSLNQWHLKIHYKEGAWVLTLSNGISCYHSENWTVKKLNNAKKNPIPANPWDLRGSLSFRHISLFWYAQWHIHHIYLMYIWIINGSPCICYQIKMCT